MPNNLTLCHFRGEADYMRPSEILTASENMDNLPLKASAADMVEHLEADPWFDLSRDLIIAAMDGQAVGFERARWAEETSRRTFWPTWHGRWKGIGLPLM